MDDTVARSGNVAPDATMSSVAKTGTTGDGDNVAVHRSCKILLTVEYLSSRNALYSAVTAEASFVMIVDPELEVRAICAPKTTKEKGADGCVYLIQFPFTSDVDVTE